MSLKQTLATAAVSAVATWAVIMVWLNPVTQPVNLAVALASRQVLEASGCLDGSGRMMPKCPADVRKQASDARKNARREFQTKVPSLIREVAADAAGIPRATSQ